ncbi:hypothetical protein D3C77_676920 [compost metagenome]
MNELVVASGIGKQVHLRLRDGEPVRHADFLRYPGGQGLRMGQGRGKVCGHGGPLRDRVCVYGAA